MDWKRVSGRSDDDLAAVFQSGGWRVLRDAEGALSWVAIHGHSRLSGKRNWVRRFGSAAAAMRAVEDSARIVGRGP